MALGLTATRRARTTRDPRQPARTATTSSRPAQRQPSLLEQAVVGDAGTINVPQSTGATQEVVHGNVRRRRPTLGQSFEGLGV